MQAHYDITRLTLRPGGVAQALPAVDRALAAERGQARGRLAAVWTSELGALNEIMIIHAIDDPAAALAARSDRARSGEWYGCNEQLMSVSASTYASFPFVPPMPSGHFGPCFEVREYGIKPDALAPLLAAWEAALPARIAVSPVMTIAYALDGAQPQMLHIWPYRDLNERARIRGDTVAQGIWPPKGGVGFLTTMRSSIYLPAPFSPLQ